MADQQTSFTIQELGDTQETRNRLELRGRAIPYRPFTLKGEQRREVTYYPGNPIGSAQVFGSAEGSTTIQGMWKDRFIVGTTVALLNGQPLADARAVVVAMDGFRRRGQLVEVTWYEITRHGIIGDFEQSWERRQDVSWSVTFDWTSQGEAETPPTIGLVSVSDASQSTAGVLEAIELEMAQLPFPAGLSLLDKLNTGLNNLRARQAELQAIVQAGVEQALAPVKAATMAMSTLTNMASDAVEFVQTLEAQVAFTFRAAVAPIGFTTGLALQTAATLRRVKAQAKALRIMGLEQTARIQAQTQNNVIHTLSGRDGDDLRTIARAMYGAAQDWRVLAVFNNARTSRVTRGQVIHIPTTTHSQ